MKLHILRSAKIDCTRGTSLVFTSVEPLENNTKSPLAPLHRLYSSRVDPFAWQNWRLAVAVLGRRPLLSCTKTFCSRFPADALCKQIQMKRQLFNIFYGQSRFPYFNRWSKMKLMVDLFGAATSAKIPCKITLNSSSSFSLNLLNASMNLE